VAWVTVPSFAENVADNKKGLERLIAELPGQRSARLIVFDVRGNRGGNSSWGIRLLQALFGDDYVRAIEGRVSSGVYTQWRASKGNADFIEQSTMPRYEKGSRDYEWLRGVVSEIRTALAGNQALTPAPTGAGAVRQRGGAAATHDLGQKVVLLTDGLCGSACLNFADVLLAIPGVRHAGTTTFADAIYIDNRSILLPSQLGFFGFSMKVYRNRGRKHNEPYAPSLVYPGASWDMRSLQDWLIRVAAP
jgi:hypothetical protein